jgi:GTP pyrophosphokinase
MTSPPLSERFVDAVAFAVRLHSAQRRKIHDTPYAAHLLAVASLALDHGATEDEAIAALLHDAVEDQGGAPTREEIRRRFGDTVAEVVDGCSDTDQLPKPPWRARKEAYIARMRSASPSVLLVSAADKVHNARSLLADYRRSGDSIWNHFKGGKEGTLWYFRALVDTYRHAAPPERTAELVDELEALVGELESRASA